MFVWCIAILAFSSVLISADADVSDKVYDNCLFLGNKRLQLSWTVRRADSMADFELCGCDFDDPTKTDSVNEYMGFGLSGRNDMTWMVGADAVIAYVDKDTGPKAIDYFLASRIQCREGAGTCPDKLVNSSCQDNIVNISGFRTDGFQCVSYSRPLDTGDTICDLPIDVDNPNQYVVWGVGGVEETAFKHFASGNVNDSAINLGRTSLKQCSGGLICPNCPAFTETVMDVTGNDATFVANIGPPAGSRGYQSIVGQAGWGITWYLNETLIPHLMVERGHTYTFISEGGDITKHPFYITDSKNGGRERNSIIQNMKETVLAGYENDIPIGVGPFCELTQTAEALQILNNCGSQSDYVSNLEKKVCSSSVTATRITWTPNDATPNTVYYQCATHRNLGYKITVLPLIGGGHRTEATWTIILLIAAALALQFM